MHSRILISTALLAVFATAFVYCTNEQPPNAGIPDATPKLTPVPTFTPEPTPVYTPEPTAAIAPAPKLTSTPTIPPAPQYLTDEIPPCTPVKGASVDPCEPGEATILSGGLGEFGSEPWSIRVFLDSDRGDGFIVAHVVLRGAYVPGTVRCDVSGGPNGIPGYMGAERQIEYRPYNLVNCFADVRVNAYIVGSGPPNLTVLERKYLHRVYSTPENVALLRNSVEAALIEGGHHTRGEVPAGGITGREHILFLDVSRDLSVEAWEVISTWDVQRLEDDTVIAVHPHRDQWRHFRPDDYLTHRSKLEMELPAFTRAVTATHQARLTEYSGRTGLDERLPMLVTDANRISQYYTAIGAYNHPFDPSVEPPPPPCGLSVADPANNPGLMLDCKGLLTAKDALAGSATLDWSVDSAISDWEGVTVAGTLSRVTKVLLTDENLSGTIPADLGDLSGLTHLDLSSNSLTGEIPRELGLLSNLQEVRLSGNSLTGCIPAALKDLPTNDLGSLNLLYCPRAPDGLAAGTVAEASIPLNWTAVSNANKYRVEYRLRSSGDWVVDDDMLTGTTHTVDGLNCESEYQFRVSAYGNGTVHAAAWSDPSDSVSMTTGECVPPTFGAASYTFSLADDADLGAVVGSVSATGSLTDDTVTYSISAGDEDGNFAIDESTGRITVAGGLSSFVGTSFSLTVETTDTSGGVATVTVTVRTSAPVPMPTPASVPTPTPTAAHVATTTLEPLATPSPNSTQTAKTAPAPTYLNEEIPPCTPVTGSSVDPCESRSDFYMGPDNRVGSLGDFPVLVEDLVSYPVEILTTHVALRGTYLPGTVRCTSGHPGRAPSYLGRGQSSSGLLIYCFADVRVNAYLLGTGPTTLTVTVYRSLYQSVRSAGDDDYGLEQLESRRLANERALSEGGRFQYDYPLLGRMPQDGGRGPLRHEYYTFDEAQQQFGPTVTGPPGGIGGREAVLFIGPSYRASVEAWMVFWTWDVERREDGVVVALHPYRHYFDTRLNEHYAEMELPALTQAVTTAHQSRVAANGGRIGEDTDLPMLETDANRLRQYFSDPKVGGYAPGVPAPAQPPPPCGLAVPDQGDNPGLMRDCMALLAAKDTLAGTATLDWSVDSAITDWEGVTVAGTPSRVTKLLLPNESLSGSIPAEIGDLSELTHLNLSSNSLTGEIPRELGGLSNLQEIRLSGNSLTGCIPAPLRDVSTNDLGSLNLLNCPPAPEGLTAGTVAEGRVPLSWTAVSNAGKYRVEYRLRYSDDWVLDDDTLIGVSHTVDGLTCMRDYLFRVSAYGNGAVHAAAWSDPSDSVSMTTGECVPPTFGAASYTFSLADDADLGAVVGSVSATGSLTDDTVTYSITGGDDDGNFAIDANSGEITISGDSSSNANSSVELTVEARDESGGSTTVTVTVAVTDTGPT